MPFILWTVDVPQYIAKSLKPAFMSTQLMNLAIGPPSVRALGYQLPANVE